MKFKDRQDLGEEQALIDIDEIERRIPHRHPFLLVDRAEDYHAHKSIVGIKCVTINEPFFPGHFPGYPVMPGVLVVEAMCQTSGVLMSKSLSIDVTDKAVALYSLDKCRFRQPVRPGDVLRMPVQVTRARGDLFKFKGQALVNGALAAEAEWAAIVVDISA